MSGICYPLVPGHEWSARVVQAPENHQDLCGKVVVPDILVCCQHCCYCRTGLPNLCSTLEEPGLTMPGGFAEFVTLPPENAHEVPEAIDPIEASLIEPLAVALYALKRVPIRAEDRIMIVGGGGIGQLLLQCAALNVPQSMILVDHHPYRLALAKKLFPELIALNPAEKSVSDFLRVNPKYAPTVSFEVTGTPEGLDDCLAHTQKAGRVGIVGYAGRDPIPAAMSHVMTRLLTLIGVLSPTGTTREAINLVASGKVTLKPLLTKTFTLESAQEAFAHSMGCKSSTLRVGLLGAV